MSAEAGSFAPQAPQDFDWRTHPRKVNLGCGWDRRAGYLNVDLHAFHEPDLLADVRACNMLPTGEYEEVVAQDVLEHLPRADVPVALAEWARLLRPGGRLVLRVPDLVGLLRLFENSSDPAQHAVLVQNLYGTQAYDGDWHRSGFTELLLRTALSDAGFDVETITHFDEWLFDVVAVRVESPKPVSDADLVFTTRGRAPVSNSAELPPAEDGAVDLALARLAAARVTTPVQPVSSRVPGGALVHRVTARLIRRHLTGIAVQTNAALDAATDALRSMEPSRRGR